MEEINKKVLGILKKYNLLAEWYALKQYPLNEQKEKYMEKHCLTADERKTLNNSGLGFDVISITHDQAVDKCFSFFESMDKSHVTAAFLSSLSNNRLEYRSGLSVFGIMQAMPKHTFIPNRASFCDICSATEEYSHFDLTALNPNRFFAGSLAVCKTPYEIAFFLEQHSNLEDTQPNKDDFFTFNEILKLVIEAEQGEKLALIIKKMKKIDKFKATNDQCRCLLETLGFCGIMETKTHKGYLTHFTNPGLAPSKSHSSIGLIQ